MNTVQIGDEAYGGDEHIETTVVGGQLQANGVSGTTRRYANFLGILAHESQHAMNETVLAKAPGDGDSDHLSNAFEAGTSSTDPDDTYSARDAGGVFTDNALDDGEVYAGGPVEENGITGANTASDRSHPGTNWE